jgi:hypothetical protein
MDKLEIKLPSQKTEASTELDLSKMSTEDFLKIDGAKRKEMMRRNLQLLADDRK